MKTQFEFEIKEDYLQLNLTGEYDKVKLLSFPVIIKTKCEKEKIFKVLVNGLEIRNSNLSTADRFFIGEKFGLELRDQIKIAVVWPAKDIDKFAETVALNRGGNMYVVGDYEAAVEWMLNSQA